MSKPIIILTILILGCTTTNKYDLFKIESYEKYELLDLGEINDIISFNERFWKSDSTDNDFSFVARFDFENGKFSNTSDKGIKIEGFPYHCLEYDCHRNYGLKLYLSDNYEVTNFEKEVLSEKQIKDLITSNILNYGKDPSRSDNPKEAATELYLTPDHEISKLGLVLKLFADNYKELIELKAKETNLTTKQLTVEFPFIIHLRELMTPPDEFKIIHMEEWEMIDDEISIDTVALNNK